MDHEDTEVSGSISSRRTAAARLQSPRAHRRQGHAKSEIVAPETGETAGTIGGTVHDERAVPASAVKDAKRARCRTTRIRYLAAGQPIGEPVARPLPNVADHVMQAPG